MSIRLRVIGPLDSAAHYTIWDHLDTNWVTCVNAGRKKMPNSNDIVSIGGLAGMPVLSLSSGNKLGSVSDVRLDPVNGRLVGLTLDGPGDLELPYEHIHSFGRDAVMAVSDDSLVCTAESAGSRGRLAKDVIGAKVVMESGEVLGEIVDVRVTLKPPPTALYELRRSMLDRLLGRTFYIPASIGYALSDDAARLVVPDRTAEIASTDISELIGVAVDVRSFPSPDQSEWDEYEDETVLRDREGDRTDLSRGDHEDETLLVPEDEDETVLRRPADRG